MNIEKRWSVYTVSLKAFLSSKVSNSADVEDVYQDTLVKAYKNIHTLKSDDNFKPWLFSIASNTVNDFYHQKKNAKKIRHNSLWYGENDYDIKRSLAQCIEPFFQSLEREIAEVMFSIDIEGQSQKSYAEQHGISYSTLKSRVQKGRRQLRELYERCCLFTFDHSGNLLEYDLKLKNCKKC
jgi:RNA polymerase sigma-70 factor (ECF subfamily)